MEKVSIDISKEEKLWETVRSFLVLFDKFHKEFEKCCEKCMEWSRSGDGIYSSR